MFGEHGPIQLVEKFDDYAFVHYENRDDAAKAVEALHGRTVDGPSLAVSFK
jgi:heterogeneous nuclear ribonucleoprotein R